MTEAEEQQTLIDELQSARRAADERADKAEATLDAWRKENAEARLDDEACAYLAELEAKTKEQWACHGCEKLGGPEDLVVRCPRCDTEVLSAATAMGREEGEVERQALVLGRDAAQLTQALYKSGPGINQPLVDDIERFRVSAQKAIYERNTLERHLSKARREIDRLRAAGHCGDLDLVVRGQLDCLREQIGRDVARIWTALEAHGITPKE